MPSDLFRHARATWGGAEPGRMIGRGHPVGDFLEAHEWLMLEERPGHLKLDVHLVDPVKNFKGHLFGGFAPTYVDLIAIRTVRAGQSSPTGWLVTMNMRLDFFEPVSGPRFFVESDVVNRRGSVALVETRFRDSAATMLVFALTTLREIESDGDAKRLDRRRE